MKWRTRDTVTAVFWALWLAFLVFLLIGGTYCDNYCEDIYSADMSRLSLTAECQCYKKLGVKQ